MSWTRITPWCHQGSILSHQWNVSVCTLLTTCLLVRDLMIQATGLPLGIGRFPYVHCTHIETPSLPSTGTWLMVRRCHGQEAGVDTAGQGVSREAMVSHRPGTGMPCAASYYCSVPKSRLSVSLPECPTLAFI